MDEQNESVEMQEVAEPVVETTESEQTQETAEPVKERDFEKDAAFAEMRRNMEQAQREREQVTEELNSIKSERERLANSLGLFGFKGTTDEIEDQAKAHYLGKDIDEVRSERIQAQKVMQEQHDREQELAQLRAEKENLQKQVNARIFEEDLRKIQAINPDVKSLEELGEKWYKLMADGWSAEDAYTAISTLNRKVTPPPEMGKVNATQKADKTYYTPEEVDALTSKQLDDPKIFAAVRKSMTMWK